MWRSSRNVISKPTTAIQGRSPARPRQKKKYTCTSSEGVGIQHPKENKRGCYKVSIMEENSEEARCRDPKKGSPSQVHWD
mmetsp:Transcript_23075/g.30628  ORF Transcript_23075/g.30628 Transcript_23075/m.30628 type:complete len:80 (+) Transcript_23075:76-315(+)